MMKNIPIIPVPASSAAPVFRRPFFAAGCFGVMLLVFTAGIALFYPQKAPALPRGFITPVLAFEFAETPEEVFGLFGPEGSAERSVLAPSMNLGNTIDFAYMAAYASFLFLFACLCARSTGRGLFMAGCALAVVILCGDIVENVQLFGITSRLSSGRFERQLYLLKIFTWIKWGGLALYPLVLLPYFRALRSRLVYYCPLPIVLAVASFAYKSFLNELLAVSVGVLFLLMTIHAFSRRNDALRPS